MRLGQQHVHVTGHPAGDRVDRVADIDTVLFQQRRECHDFVLRPSGGKAVARHDDDFGCIGQLNGGVIRGNPVHGRGRARPGCRTGGIAGAEAAHHDADDRAVHRFGHEHGEDSARSADERACDDEDAGVEHEAGDRHGRAGERVE